MHTAYFSSPRERPELSPLDARERYLQSGIDDSNQYDWGMLDQVQQSLAASSMGYLQLERGSVLQEMACLLPAEQWHGRAHILEEAERCWYKVIERSPGGEEEIKARTALAYLQVVRNMLVEGSPPDIDQLKADLTSVLAKAVQFDEQTARYSQEGGVLGAVTELNVQVLTLDYATEAGLRLIPWPSLPRQDSPWDGKTPSIGNGDSEKKHAWDITLIDYDEGWEEQARWLLQIKSFLRETDRELYEQWIVLIGGNTHLGYTQDDRLQLARVLTKDRDGVSLQVELAKANIIDELGSPNHPSVVKTSDYLR